MSIQHLETVLNALVPYAKVELEKGGVLVPFAGSLDQGGEIELHVPRNGEDTSTEDFLNVLRAALREGVDRGAFRATGLCMDVRAHHPEDEEEVDAICIHLEAAGESLLAFLPYGPDEDERMAYGEIFFGPADPCAFAGNGAE